MRSNLKILIILLTAVTGLALVYILSPQDKTLGTGTSLVLLHGAWVWTGLAAFSAAAFFGLLGILFNKFILHRLSRVCGNTALVFWLTYLPMSLLVMQANWSGFYFEEPRWKIPFAFAIIALLLQSGLAIIDKPYLTSSGNLAFGIALIYLLAQADTVLHPNAPVFTGSKSIQTTYLLILILCLVIAVMTCYWLYHRLYQASSPHD